MTAAVAHYVRRERSSHLCSLFHVLESVSRLLLCYQPLAFDLKRKPTNERFDGTTGVKKNKKRRKTTSEFVCFQTSSFIIRHPSLLLRFSQPPPSCLLFNKLERRKNNLNNPPACQVLTLAGRRCHQKLESLSFFYGQDWKRGQLNGRARDCWQ